MQVRAEHLDSPLGIGEREPRLSWVPLAGSGEQLAYEVEVDGIPVRVEGDAHVLVPWPGKALGSGERREVRVRVETEAGLGEWSEPLVVEAGLLDPDDWSAAWVSTGAEAGAAGHRPAYRLRGEITVDEPVVRARLYATAHGIYELVARRATRRDRRADAGLHGVRLAHAGADVRRHGPAGARQPRGRGVARRRLVPRPGRHAQRPRPVGHRDGVPRPAPPRARGRQRPPSSAPTRRGAGRRRTSPRPT